MANGAVTITEGELQKSAVKFKNTLLQMPVKAIAETLNHMTLRTGVRGREIVGELSGDIEMGPYDPKRVDETGVTINPRTLETFLGSVVKKFEPNSVWKTVYGNLITKGEGLKNVDITLQVLTFLCAKLGAGLDKVLWSADRNDGGTKTVDLFNGFDTITADEKLAGTIAEEHGNMATIVKITADNAVDVLKKFYRAADEQLKAQQTKLFIPQAIYDAYVDDYQATVGAIPYNQQFEKTFLEGSRNRCELVPLANKASSKYIHLPLRAICS